MYCDVVFNGPGVILNTMHNSMRVHTGVRVVHGNACLASVLSHLSHNLVITLSSVYTHIRNIINRATYVRVYCMYMWVLCVVVLPTSRV